MGFGSARKALVIAAVGAAMLGGCAPIREHQGYIADETLITAIQPGVDTRDSVAATLGRPSFTGQFDQRDWYYVSRSTSYYAFNRPAPEEQTVLHVRFDEAGNVAAVNRTGVDLVASINPMGDETPTLGRERGFFEELFGNIGTVGSSGQAGRTADNPD